METNNYDYKQLGVFQEAKQRSIDGMGYRARRFKIIWQSKTTSWQHIAFEWGIRWSEKWQIFPIWITSNNSSKALTFGFWKLFFEIVYYRNKSFNQNRKFLFRRKLWKFYQLIC